MFVFELFARNESLGCFRKISGRFQKGKETPGMPVFRFGQSAEQSRRSLISSFYGAFGKGLITQMGKKFSLDGIFNLFRQD